MRWLAVVLVLAIAAPVVAQPAGPAPVDRRDRIKQRIRALRAYTLTEQLALDQQTAGKLFPLLAKFDDEFDRLLQARLELQRRLMSATDPRVLNKLIDDAVANQRALWDTEDKRLAELRKILTPAQTARVLLVLPMMERKIQNQLRKAVQRQPKDPFAGRADDTDDDDLLPDENPRPRKNAAPATRVPANKVCDPFTSLHGCK